MARKSNKRRRQSIDQNSEPADIAVPVNEKVMIPNAADSEQPQLDSSGADDQPVLDAVDSNTKLLEKIQAQLEGLCEGMVSHMSQIGPSVAASATDLTAGEVTAFDSDETATLRDHVFDLEAQVEQLKQQNSDLSSQVASAKTRDNVETIVHSDETLSWEDRKQLILQQMEDDDFDSDEFADSLSSEVKDELAKGEGPAHYIQRLNDELARREQDIADLRHLWEQQSETREEGVSIGAAGIAEMIDSDELVREERERLQKLQVEWEEKFRQSEIEASLERAKLSRERRELAAKQTQLAEELERARLKDLQASEKDGPRKWLSQLGLSGT